MGVLPHFSCSIPPHQPSTPHPPPPTTNPISPTYPCPYPPPPLPPLPPLPLTSSLVISLGCRAGGCPGCRVQAGGETGGPQEPQAALPPGSCESPHTVTPFPCHVLSWEQDNPQLQPLSRQLVHVYMWQSWVENIYPSHTLIALLCSDAVAPEWN